MSATTRSVDGRLLRSMECHRFLDRASKFLSASTRRGDCSAVRLVSPPCGHAFIERSEQQLVTVPSSRLAIDVPDVSFKGVA